MKKNLVLILALILIPGAALSQEAAAPQALPQLSSGTMNALIEQYHVDLEILKHKIRLLEQELEDMEFKSKRMEQDYKNLFSIKGLRITGRGRTWFGDVLKSGKAVGNQPYNAVRERDTMGYFEFHLTGRPDEKVLAYAEFRATGILGGDWGTGNTFQFRRVYLGLDTKFASEKGGERMEMGSIQVDNTPLTLRQTWTEPEGSPALFWYLHREAALDDNVLYQALAVQKDPVSLRWPDVPIKERYFDNLLAAEGLSGRMVPLTGIHFQMRRSFKKIPEAYANIVAVTTNNLPEPDFDQYFFLGRLDVKPRRNLRFGVEAFWHADIKSTGNGPAVPEIRPISARALGGLGEARFGKEDRFGVKAEGLGELFGGERGGEPFDISDTAFSAAADFRQADRHGVVIREVELRVSDVGPYYYAFTAQGRAFDPLELDRTGLVNSYSPNNPGFLRTNAFNPVLDNAIRVGEYEGYSRMEDNAMPYGPATPNRQGLELTGRLSLKDEAIKPFLYAAYQREIQPNFVFDYFGLDGMNPSYRSVEAIGVGLSPVSVLGTRSFITAEAGGSIDMGKLIWEKSLIHTLRVRYQSTENSPESALELPVAMKNLLIQWGVEAKVDDKLSLLGAFEKQKATGTEYFLTFSGSTTDAVYQTLFGYQSDYRDRYSHLAFDFDRSTLAAGVMFRLTNSSEMAGLYEKTVFHFDQSVVNGLPSTTTPGSNDQQADEVQVWVRVMF